MSWCLSTILSVATIVHCVVFGVCNVLDIHCVPTSVHHVVFPLLMASTTPTLAFFACWSFVGGGRLLVGYFGQKLYPSSTFIVFAKLIHFCSFWFYFPILKTMCDNMFGFVCREILQTLKGTLNFCLVLLKNI